MVWLGVLLTLGLSGYVAYRSAPDVVKDAIEDRYPVKIDAVELQWGVVRLINVQVDQKVGRFEVDGVLKQVDVIPFEDGAVYIDGGSIEVEVGKATEAVGAIPGRARPIYGKNLNVVVERGESSAVLTGVEIVKESSRHDVRFKRGVFEYDGHQAIVSDGFADGKRPLVFASKVEVEVNMPFELPLVTRTNTLTLHGVQIWYDERNVSADKLTYGPVTAEQVHLHVDEELKFGAASVEVNHRWVALYPVRFKTVTVYAPLDIQQGKGEVLIGIGPTTLTFNPETYSLDGEASCSNWLGLVPTPLPEALKNAAERFKGELTFHIQVKPEPEFDLWHSCKYSCARLPIAPLRKAKWTYLAYNKDGKRVPREMGMNVEGWTSLTDLPLAVYKAFVTLEDPGFYRHRGILPGAIKNSLIANLEKGTFVKGGSTITQQLAKNLWLRRHKTLMRKVHEAFLAMALESCFSKSELLEIYLNVIEFGPDLYGIGPATQHFFKKGVARLQPVEAFYLAKRLPKPLTKPPPTERVLAGTHRLMLRLANSGFISKHMLVDDRPLDTTGWEVNE